MKRMVLVLSLLLTISCKENKESSLTAEVEQEVISSESLVNQQLVPIVDYKGLMPFLETENDTTYVVNFWATWCKPCVKELPAFETLGKNYKDDKLKVILVSLDFPENLESRVIPFIQKKGLASDVILLDDADANSWIPKISETWSGAIPATLIYSKNKRAFFEQSFTYATLENEVQQFK